MMHLSTTQIALEIDLLNGRTNENQQHFYTIWLKKLMGLMEVDRWLQGLHRTSTQTRNPLIVSFSKISCFSLLYNSSYQLWLPRDYDTVVIYLWLSLSHPNRLKDYRLAVEQGSELFARVLRSRSPSFWTVRHTRSDAMASQLIKRLWLAS